MKTSPPPTQAQPSPLALSTESLLARYVETRQATERICQPLEVEDYCIQSMPDASPTKWHLAHTSWFFETFVLQRCLDGYRSPHPRYAVLFNSYYNTVGEQHSRPERGLLSRPTVAEVMEYRAHVDRAIGDLFHSSDVADAGDDLLSVVETGIHHEQQHQELILMDIKHAFSRNPLRPAYRALPPVEHGDVPPLDWIPVASGVREIGHAGGGFSFDNEGPRHRTFVEAFQISDRLVTCGEYLEFIEDDGYKRPELWLSDGWRKVQSSRWQAPLYWIRDQSSWQMMSLGGIVAMEPGEPVSHVSYYEADAFARWKGCWLPREGAWETTAAGTNGSIEGNFFEQDQLRPLPAPPRSAADRPCQLFGDLWEWTCSPYGPYPGFRANEGALGEYNGKFMCNQIVLRGGSYGTPKSHIRDTYRNFYPPEARWPFTGIRLTKEYA